ncbi:transporter substrate-binding domain-containing protein [Vibrio sp. T187]|uniref:ATP-binding protein n=1 Tax=Vibrio TaxID=662 RepID=UPI0010CA120D|nr:MULTISPECIES: transporter substrate-binding domain-containing protein [Vibrio]MBW3697769.1 transporter substrate-binding domain-containing protein [Vibrio sp. T187]
MRNAIIQPLIVFAISFMFSVSLYAKTSIDFTQSEQDWMESNQKISVLVRGDKYPYMFINSKGEIDGIIPEFMDELTALAGVGVDYELVKNTHQAKMMLQNGQADIYPLSFPFNPEFSELLYSTPFLPYQRQLITRSSETKVVNVTQLRDKTIGVVKGAEMTKWFKSHYPRVKTIEFATDKAAITAVSKGKVFGVITEIVAAMDLAEKLRFDNLKPNSSIQGWTQPQASLAISQHSATLNSIMNKALAELSYATQNHILSFWLKDNPYRMKVDGAFDYGNPPYMYADSPTLGLEYSFLQKVFNNMGYQLGEIKRAPISTRESIFNSDSSLEFNSGLTTLVQDDGRLYSDPILEIEYVAITLQAREIDLSAMGIQGELAVGSILQDGASPSRKAFEAFSEMVTPKVSMDFSSLKDSFEALVNNGVDVVVVEKRVLEWFLEHESSLDRSAIHIHREFSQMFPIYMEFRDEILRDKFNASIKDINANGQKLRKFFDEHIESDYRPQLRRTDILAQLVAYYLYSNNIDGLDNLFQIFDLSQDIAAIEIYDEKQERKLYSVLSTSQGFVSDAYFDTSQFVSVLKDSVYLTESGPLTVGKVKFYFDSHTTDNGYAYLPSLSLFSALSDNELSYVTKIYQANDLTGQILNLTPSEIEWIKANPIQKVGVDPKALPYEAFNDSGKYVGVLADFLKLIESKTGLKFEPQLVSNWDETVELGAQREVSMISAALENQSFLIDYEPSVGLVSNSLAIGSKSDISGLVIADLVDWKVGILKGASNTEAIMTSYPQVDWVLVDNTMQGLDLVENNDLDAMLDTIHVLNYLINVNNLRTMRVVGRSDYKVTPTFHVLRTEPILHNILDKAIESIPQQDKNDIVKKWTAPKYIDKTNYQLIYTVIGFSVLFILISAVWNRRLKAQVEHTKKARAEAEHLQEQMFGVLKASPIAAAIIQDERVIYTNERALELFKLDKEYVEDLNVESIYPDPAVREEIYQEMISNERVVNKELELRKSDGKIFTALTSYYRIEHQDHFATLFWAYDISEQKALNIQLEQAMLDADSANQAKSDFLANMSHEIRTPMNAILGMSYLAMQEQQSREAANYVKKVHRSAESLLSIINDILDFSKIEAGKLNIEHVPFLLTHVIEELQDVVAIKANEKSLDLSLTTSNDVPTAIVGDSVRLFQILLNLLGNAVKFTQQGSVSLHVSVVSLSDQQARLSFNVCDTGIGISEEQLHHLFEAFSQADASTTRKYGGTGLGLNISQKLVHAMGGVITVTSELGQGSCFNVELDFPLSDEQLDTNHSGLHRTLDVDFQQADILLVEDNVTNQELAMAFLDKFNTKVEIANNGLEALEKAKDKAYDVILMDLQMPVMDGFEASQRLRESGNGTPIIAMSANVLGDVKERASERGVDDFVEKPVIIEKLAGVLDKWIARTDKVVDLGSSRTHVDRKLKSAVLDVQLGLTYCNQDEALLDKLIHRFDKQIDTIANEYRRLLQEGDASELVRYSHTLKSTSAAIGASKVSEAFGDLENYFEQVGQQSDVEQRLTELSKALELLHAQIERYRSEHKLVSSTQKGIKDSDPIEDNALASEPIERKQVEHLITLIESYDVDARAEVMRLMELFPDSQHSLESVMSQLEEYEFDAALEALNSWLGANDS